MTRALFAATACLLISPVPVFAQWTQWQDRVLVSVNAAAQLTSGTIHDAFEYDHPYGAGRERASVTTDYEVPTGAMFDGSVAVRIVGSLGAGVAVSASSTTSDLGAHARIPHPFYFNRFRDVEGSVAARHSETGIHLQAVYVVPLTPKVLVAVSGGPSHFSVEQRVARSVTVSETFPFDTATFSDAPLETLKTDAWGFNVGVDVGWMLARHFGVGGMVRFSRANATFVPTGRDGFDANVGGLEAGGGVRVRF